MLQRILVADVNVGYDDATFAPAVLQTVDGETVRHLEHLVELVDGAKGAHVRFGFASGLLIALDRAACLKRDPETLRMNGVPARCSADLEPASSGSWGSLILRGLSARLGRRS